MNRLLALLCSYFLISSLTLAADRPNVLLICVDDLRPELHCYGVDYIHSPNIDALASEGTIFKHHYVQAPTCGASRNALLTGLYGGNSNGALFQRAKSIENGQEIPPSMPAWFRNNGYTTVSVGKVSHHPGGRGGPDWNDSSEPEMPNSWDRHLLPAGEWLHPRGWMHGLANGEIRKNAKDMDVFQSLDGPDTIYPDGVSTDEALRQVDLLASNNKTPFFLAFGILRPHLPFGAPAKYMDHYKDATLPKLLDATKPQGKTTWHQSGEFMKYNRWKRNPNEDEAFAIEVRKHYAACVSFADAQVGRIVAKLKSAGLWKNTIVVLWGDHGWHLGEHAIWGKHALFEESLRSPLVIRVPSSASSNNANGVNSVVESIDIFPTLCELTNLPMPDFAHGDSLVSMLNADASKPAEQHSAVSYFKSATTIRTKDHRLILHKGGFVELYDHRSDPTESNNVADARPDQVRQLSETLSSRIPNSKTVSN